MVQCGVVLQNLQDELKEFKLFYPPDPTEKSCFIGGTIATNASGARTFKYGATRNWVEKLKVIVSNGNMLKLIRGNSTAVGDQLELITTSGDKCNLTIPEVKLPNVKNAAGYFLKKNMDAIDLFIGSEGTLGLIVEAELKLLPMPNDLISSVAFFNSFDDAIGFVDEVKLNSSVTSDSIIKARAIEFLDDCALRFLKPHFPRIPENKFAIWFEQELYDENKDALFEEWIKLLEKHNCSIDDTWYALNEKEINEIREFRHAAPTKVNEYIAQNNFRKVGTDTAVESSKLKLFYKFCAERCQAKKVEFVTYGHIGNDHLHLNMLPKNEEEYSIAKNLYREFCI
ncbi:MAG: FAD-binding oxidoreductase, partial [Ignavibacteria bacterium]|nr:FAD-binding oxidoreductase [Ignavibacteria bacterium]